MDAALTALTSQVTSLEGTITAEATAVEALVQEITTLDATVETLKQNNPGITDAEIEPITKQITALTEKAQAIVTAAQAAPPAAAG